MSNLTIHGYEKYGIVLREAPIVEMTVDGVKFICAVFRFGGHLYSMAIATLISVSFEASVVEMNFISPDQVNATIFQTVFATGFDQNNVISLCVDNGSAITNLSQPPTPHLLN